VMKKEIGNPQFPVWLLGDSEPTRWRDRLDHPLDRRHPIRHNIWTSVLDVIQAEVFLALGKRVDADRMFVRNAVQNADTKPSEPFNPSLPWHSDAEASLVEYQGLVRHHRPRIVVSFGYFAFAFALRASGEGYGELSASRSQSGLLGCEFRKRVNNFDLGRTNVLPLLHRSIAGGRFLSGHDEFNGNKGANYFEEAGKAIAGILSQHHGGFDCWVKRSEGSAA
jgi:hypothetical protein